MDRSLLLYIGQKRNVPQNDRSTKDKSARESQYYDVGGHWSRPSIAHVQLFQ